MREWTQFWVTGIPRPKGSLQAIPKKGARGLFKGGEGYYRIRDLIYIPSSEHLASWVRAIQAAALEHKPSTPNDGPWALEIFCYFPRPETVKPPHHELHTSGKGPDGDKLLRAVCDALEGVFWLNDGHISDKTSRKRWDDGRGPGMDVTIRYLAAQTNLFDR